MIPTTDGPGGADTPLVIYAGFDMQIASFMKNEIEEMFARIDTNGDLRISFDEYYGLMRDMDHSKSNQELRTSFDAIDLDHDGRVSFDEFCAWIVR